MFTEVAVAAPAEEAIDDKAAAPAVLPDIKLLLIRAPILAGRILPIIKKVKGRITKINDGATKSPILSISVFFAKFANISIKPDLSFNE